MAIDLTFRGDGIEFGTPRVFADGPFPRVIWWSYDIGADGRVLTFTNADEQSAPRLGVVTNFPELIRRKVPSASTP